ncbi:hypothetical protein GCM10023165_34300 [Variovorax defluvii]|uniref:Type III secretion protein n=1 Tax=Variovorax defluvii TaxID=913761 RepID=A0ABP8HZX4_9BURK
MSSDPLRNPALPAKALAEVRWLVHEFDQWPAEYLDTSRRGEFIPPPVPATLWDHPRARRHLSRHIVRVLDLQPCGTRRSSAEWPVALLKGRSLHRLALHVAAVACAGQVRRCLLREDVLAWREWLTPAPFEFAQRTASLLPLKPDASPDIDRAVSAESTGLRWLARAAQAWPEPVAARFLLKLPRPDAESPCDAEPAAAMRLVSSVLSIVEPRWCSLLSTHLH